MKVKVSHISCVLGKYNLDIRYLKDIATDLYTFLSNEIVEKDQISILESESIESIDVFFSEKLYEALSTEFPLEYRKPYGCKRFIEINEMIEELSIANAHSFRKRHIVLVGDIYSYEWNKGKIVTLFEHNQVLDFGIWNVKKRGIDKNVKILYRFNELPIIVFVDMNNTDKKYVQKFKMNTDLISLLVSKSTNQNKIAPDFIPTEDVISVTDPDKLLEEYVRTGARLIVIGEKLDEAHKKALIKVKHYDKFVRMIVISSISHNNIDHFFRKIHLVYNSNRWEDILKEVI